MFDDYNFNSCFIRWFFLWTYSLLIPMIIIASNIWVKISVSKAFNRAVISNCIKMVLNRGSGAYLRGFPLTLVSLFYIILSVNLSNRVPYFFRVRAHFSFGFSFAILTWVSLIISRLETSFIQNIALLVPRGCPLVLSIFMVALEVITNLLRPITLIIRLAINIATGKVIMLLLRNAAINLLFSFRVRNYCLFSIISGLGFAIFSLEVAVRFIQRYIFCILLCLYADEHRK